MYKKQQKFILNESIEFFDSRIKKCSFYYQSKKDFEYEGLWINKYGSGFNVNIKIFIKELNKNKIEIILITQFDIFTKMFVLFSFMTSFGLIFKVLTTEKEPFWFMIIVLFLFPFFAFFISKYTFNAYNNSIKEELKLKT